MLATTGARSRPPVMVELNIYSPVTSVLFHHGQEAYSIRKYPQNAIARAATNERPSVVFRACLLRRLLWLEVRFPVRADYGLRAAVCSCMVLDRRRVQLVFVISENCWNLLREEEKTKPDSFLFFCV